MNQERKFVIVDGLLMTWSCLQHNQVVQCDICKIKFDGDSFADKLRKKARDAGWTGDMQYNSTNDRCPNCKGNDGGKFEPPVDKYIS